MKVSKEIKILRELFDYKQDELAEILGVSVDSINRWENDAVEIEERNLELLYGFAYKKKFNINKIYEQIIIENLSKLKLVPLFHGAKSKINFPINFSFSKNNNDFGKGFYLGDNFEQASTYISNSYSKYVYSFCLDIDELNVIEYEVSLERMLTIAYFRGWLSKYKDNEKIKSLVKRVRECDVVIAPIADNRMFDIISEFINGTITDEQCQHSLAATNLGKQYVLKSELALTKLSLVKEHYLCEEEKNSYKHKRLDAMNLNYDKVKLAYIEYRGKGQYIDEILK